MHSQVQFKQLARQPPNPTGTLIGVQDPRSPGSCCCCCCCLIGTAFCIATPCYTAQQPHYGGRGWCRVARVTKRKALLFILTGEDGKNKQTAGGRERGGWHTSPPSHEGECQGMSSCHAAVWLWRCRFWAIIVGDNLCEELVASVASDNQGNLRLQAYLRLFSCSYDSQTNVGA